MMYNNKIRDYFFLPLHVGELDCTQPRTVLFSTAPYSSKDIIALFMSCDEDYCIKELYFKTNGNPYLVAALEYACRAGIGQKLDNMALDINELTMQLEIPFNQAPVLFSIQTAFKKLAHLMSMKRKGEL